MSCIKAAGKLSRPRLRKTMFASYNNAVIKQKGREWTDDFRKCRFVGAGSMECVETLNSCRPGARTPLPAKVCRQLSANAGLRARRTRQGGNLHRYARAYGCKILRSFGSRSMSSKRQQTTTANNSNKYTQIVSFKRPSSLAIKG